MPGSSPPPGIRGTIPAPLPTGGAGRHAPPRPSHRPLWLDAPRTLPLAAASCHAGLSEAPARPRGPVRTQCARVPRCDWCGLIPPSFPPDSRIPQNRSARQPSICRACARQGRSALATDGSRTSRHKSTEQPRRLCHYFSVPSVCDHGAGRPVRQLVPADPHAGHSAGG